MKKILRNSILLSLLIFNYFNSIELCSQNVEYDKLNRIIEVQFPDNSSIAYTYDKIGNRIGYEVTTRCDYLGEVDMDKDGICDFEDNCVDIFNPKQEDINENGEGDICECTFVLTTADFIQGSLRSAIDCAESGDTIVFANTLAGDTLLVNSEEIVIDKMLFIITSENISLKSNITGRMLNIVPEGDLYVEGLELFVLSSSNFASILNEGILTLNNVTIHEKMLPPLIGTLDNKGDLRILGVSSFLK
jgi:YD repeat-containing protein